MTSNSATALPETFNMTEKSGPKHGTKKITTVLLRIEGETPAIWTKIPGMPFY